MSGKEGEILGAEVASHNHKKGVSWEEGVESESRLNLPCRHSSGSTLGYRLWNAHNLPGYNLRGGIILVTTRNRLII